MVAIELLSCVAYYEFHEMFDAGNFESFLAICAFSSRISKVMILVCSARSASANHMVELPPLVPISMRRPSGANEESRARNLPVSGGI